MVQKEIGEGGKLGKRHTLGADVARKVQRVQSVAQKGFGERPLVAEGVDKGFAPLAKALADEAKHGVGVGARNGRAGAQVHAHHGRLHLGGRHEAAGRHPKEDARQAAVFHGQGNGAAFGGADGAHSRTATSRCTMTTMRLSCGGACSSRRMRMGVVM